MNHINLPPLSLYIHYPWCVKKCPYCDFNSHEGENRSGYIEALLADLDDDLNYIQNRKIHSIFIGGGTPSLMNGQELDELFVGLKNRLNFEKDIEITLEANPGTFEVEKFKAFKEIGINRLSIGVQSFNNENLKTLGRIHSAEEAVEACVQASKIFDNFNIDLMYALQAQTIEKCLSDLQQALDLNPTHISFYQLTIEPNTLFAKFPPVLPKEDELFSMGEAGVNLLEQHGFSRYEVSAFGKIPSKHNINYWEFGDYIGIGAGAHGKITLAQEQKIIRTLKSKAPKDYIENCKKTTEAIENITFEFMLNALRLKKGFDFDLFESHTGQSIKTIEAHLAKAQALDLLIMKEKNARPSEKGYNFLNDLQAIFL